jgi:hypothetical protein
VYELLLVFGVLFFASCDVLALVDRNSSRHLFSNVGEVQARVCAARGREVGYRRYRKRTNS